MKVLIVGHVDMGQTVLTELSKNYDVVIVESKEIERPKEEVFMITAPPIIEYTTSYLDIKEQQPWKQRRNKNNWKSKRRKK